MTDQIYTLCNHYAYQERERERENIWATNTYTQVLEKMSKRLHQRTTILEPANLRMKPAALLHVV